MRDRTNIKRGERGQATVEFALLLPILLLVSLALLDFGKAFNAWLDETHLANAAARWAVVNKLPYSSVTGCSPQTISCQLQNNEATGELKSGSSSVTPVTISFCFPGDPAKVGQVGQPVRATVSTTYTWLSFLRSGPFRIPGLAASKPITTAATMRLEQAYDGTSYVAVTGCP